VSQKDLENSHVPRLRNIIVAPVNPTERLKKWREDHPDRERATVLSSQSPQIPSSNSETRLTTPDYRIGTGARGGDWRLENALFVSSRAQGTRVLHCPSPQELHKKTWNEDFGRGGKLVQERIVNQGEPDGMDHTPDQVLPLKRKKSFADLCSMRSFVNVTVLPRIESINFVPEKLNTSLHRKLSARSRGWHSKQANTRKKAQGRTRHHPDLLLGRFANEVKIYESDPAVRNLPDPKSDIGQSYYNNILTWPLPPGISVPSPRFARRHGLVPEELPLPGGLVIKLVPTADEMAIGKNFQDTGRSKSPGNAINLAGPFTPELFKDSGIDFPQHWGNTKHIPAVGKFEVETLSDMGTLGDAAQSPSKDLQSISQDIQASSKSVLTRSEQEHRIYTLEEPSYHPLKKWRVESTVSLPNIMITHRRRWHRFAWKRCLEGTPSGTAPVTGVLREPRSVLTHPLTGLVKTFQQTYPESFHPEDGENSPLASLLKEHNSLDKLRSLGQFHSKNLEVMSAENCASNESANTTQPSIITVIRSCNSAGNEIEADEMNKPFHLMDIPDITVNPLDGSKEHSTQTFDSEKISASKTHQRYKIGPLTRGNSLQIEPAINTLDSTMIEGNSNGKSIVEIALEILQETGYVHSEMMLNFGSSSTKRYKRVLNNNKAETFDKRENNNFKFFVTNSLEGTPANSLTLTHKVAELTQGWLDLQKASEMDLNRDLPPLPLATDSQSLQLGDQSQQHSLELREECTLELLRPLCYDPVRDSLKYGGLHYHPDGMCYHPEVCQHPPRTSSMPQTATPLETSMASKHYQVEERQYLQPSPAANSVAQDVIGPIRASDASYGSEGSSGIMGNFIPVKIVASPFVNVTRAVHVPRIKYIFPFLCNLLQLITDRTDCSMWATDQQPKPNTTYEKAVLQE
jgi:hypothetical protein